MRHVVLVLLAAGAHPAKPMKPLEKPAETACKAAIAEVGSRDPRSRPLHVHAGCAALYSDKNCRGAWNDVSDSLRLFPQRWEHLEKQCGDAYCARLPEPPPDACLPRTEATEETWLELNRAVLRLEGFDEALADQLAPFYREPSDAGWPAPVVEVKSGAPAATLTLFASDGGVVSTLALPGFPDEEQLGPLRQSLGPLCRGAVTMRMEKKLPLRVLRPVMLAVADAGCEYQEFSTLR